MRNLFILCLALVGTYSANAQVFDNYVNYTTTTNPLYANDGVKVLWDNGQTHYYHLSHIAWWGGAIVTKFDQFGNVVWAQPVNVTAASYHYYTMSFNHNESEIAIVGTVVNGTNQDLLVTTISTATGLMTNSQAYKINGTGKAVGMTILYYATSDEYIVAGNYSTCQNCDHMFLARIDRATLAIGWNGFFNDVNTNQYEVYRDMVLYDDEVTLLGFRNNIELMLFHFDLPSNLLTYNYGGGANTIGLLYSEILETPPHFIVDVDAGGVPFHFIGAGISTQQGAINVLLTRTAYSNFAIQWSNRYVDMANVSNQIWSPGRLKVHNNRMVTSFRTANSTLPNNGIILVNKNNGNLLNAIEYDNWSNAHLYEVQSLSGAQTFMTGEYSGGMRYFDGNQFGVNNSGCGYASRNIMPDPEIPSVKPYEFQSTTLLSSTGSTINQQTVNGNFTDCSGGFIGSFKKEQTTGLDEAHELANTVYPNPTSGILTVSVNDDIQQVRLTNLHGQVLITITQLRDQLTLDLSSYPAGIYLVELQGSESIESIRVSKY